MAAAVAVLVAAASAPSWAQVAPASTASAASAPASPAASAGEGIKLRAAPSLSPEPRGDAARRLPIVVQAREISGRPDLETQLEGDAEFRRGSLVITSDKLNYDHPEDMATARGHVQIRRDGNTYSGPEAQLRVERFEGYFDHPTYYFGRVGAGGKADRVDFIDDQRSVATNATYTSCLPDGQGAPAWILTTDKVSLDLETNTGVAQGAVLRFMGVPILGAPTLSFPLTDERKSGWLPPTFIPIDSNSGARLSVPYYWNIAPNRDATITPGVSARRGPSVDTEFRYFDAQNYGQVNANILPRDQSTGKARYSLRWLDDTTFLGDGRFTAHVNRVSDDAYWKDFVRAPGTVTPRLLLGDMQVAKPFGDWTGYARVQRWQVLQQADGVIEAPYERLPQIGTRGVTNFGPGLQFALEGEFNHFANPDGTLVDRVSGERVHALGSISRPYITPGWSLTPKVSFNAASYSLDRAMADGRTRESRVIPTVSLDSAWTLERDTSIFGKAWRQTLEPRLMYVNTPYRDQTNLPNFDSSGKDFNFESVFSENAFNGVDRVSDSHQITGGVTTRIIDPATGAEALRLGVVQRYLLREQRITPTGTPLKNHWSDLLLLASVRLIPKWTLDTSVDYNPDIKRTQQSLVSVRYSPGPFRTINATYRMTRDSTEQVELGWQWPLFGQTPDERVANAQRSSGGSCSGSLYTVGRINYSRRDSRVIDSVAGLEYDAGCWIGRVVYERLSTGVSEATTRVMLQLELVGFSRLGSNPLQVLRDNIPGYRLLRDGRTNPGAANFYD